MQSLPVNPRQLRNFVWRHEKYVHPRYILERDNVSLMGVTPTHAFFCVSDPGGCQLIEYLLQAKNISPKNSKIAPKEGSPE